MKRKHNIGDTVKIEVLGLGILIGKIIGYEPAYNFLPISSKHHWNHRQIYTSPKQKITEIKEEGCLYYVETKVGHEQKEILITEECITENSGEIEDKKG